jgi:HlyD family secretion protein
MRRVVLLTWGMWALQGCTPKAPTVLQGYAEGEFLYMASPFGGRLMHLAVQRGQSIAKEALLFQLESVEEKAALRQVEQQINDAQAQAQDVKTGKRPLELGVIQAQWAQAKANYHQASLQLKRDEGLLKENAVSKAQWEASQALEVASRFKMLELEKQLEVAKLPARSQQIKAQEARVATFQANLEQAQWRLKQKQVFAPEAGLVYDTLYREGEWVSPGSPVVRFLPPQNIKVRVFLPESLLGTVKLNQVFEIRCDGCGRSLSASVSYISNEAEYTPPIIYSNETRSKLVYRVEARVKPEEAVLLHPGQPIEVVLPLTLIPNH